MLFIKLSCYFFSSVLITLFAFQGKLIAKEDNAKNPANNYSVSRTLTFAGVEWNVKSGGPSGPGPNYWTDAPQDVYVDELGRLHLKIVKKGSLWYCSEVYTINYSAYGEHRFLVDGYIDRLDPNMVLGMFVYADDETEIDIEYSKWGNGADYKKVGGYNIQPYYISGNSHQFESPLNNSLSTHFFNWQVNGINFASIQGHHYGEPPSPTDYIEKWSYTGSYIPVSTENLRTHLNFWLFSGTLPQDLSVTEIIITDVVQPLSSALNDPEKETALTKYVMLHQNFPNPFNSETSICYDLYEASDVVLEIFDLYGRLVQASFFPNQEPNSYTLQLEGRNLSSGIYYYQLKTNLQIETKKMLLIR